MNFRNLATSVLTLTVLGTLTLPAYADGPLGSVGGKVKGVTGGLLGGGAEVDAGVGADAQLGLGGLDAQAVVALDVNGDGRLSREEAAANARVAAAFDRADANDDDYVTLGELGAAAGGELGQSLRTLGRGAGSAGSAVVGGAAGLGTSGAQLAGALGAKAAARLDGQFSALDVNGDGTLSATEAKADAALAGAFEAGDADGDGRLSEAEFNALVQANANANAEAGVNADNSRNIGATTAERVGLREQTSGRIRTAPGVKAVTGTFGTAGGIAADAVEKARGEAGALGTSTAAFGAGSVSALIGQLDRDDDGLVTKAEAEGNADLSAAFGALDKDNSGALTRAELSAGASAGAHVN